jgi:polyisoprenoid-binding protein YceI
MVRRIVIILSVCALVVLVVSGVLIQRLIFGGAPKAQHPTVSTPSVEATPCATLALSSGERGFALDSQHSTAGYEAHFQAAGQPAPGIVDGATGFVSGGFILSSNPRPTVRSLTIQVDLRTLNSGSPERDAHVRNDTFEVAQYPFTTFVVNQSPALAETYADGQRISFSLSGTLTLHGVSWPVTFAMTATLTGDTLTGSGAAHVKITDFGMKQPQITSAIPVTIADDIALSVDFLAHPTNCQSRP